MTLKNKYKEINLNQEFSQLERNQLERWEELDIPGKYLQKNKSSQKTFSFLDGPITANNPMGVHHAWGRTYKDVFQRYKNMRGFRQRFQNGFDAQGLWVEVEVEKELGFKSKKDIETYGVEKFVQKCKDRVKKYSDIQTSQSQRLGYFMDWDNSYFTLSDDNNYLIWHFLKVCNNNGWLYKGNESVPWCPRCETAISQHEILTEDYHQLTHDSVIIKFPLLDYKNEYFLVWTTTPWTIPANIAIAVDKNIDYSLIEIDKEKYWIADGAITRIVKDEFKKLKTVKGSELDGLKYIGPFDHLPAVKEVAISANFHKVVLTDERLMPISTDEGTGLVHTAVSAGTEDYRLGKKLDLPMIPVINDDASYKEGLGFLSGLNAKDKPEIILDYLKKDESDKSWVYKIFPYNHRYPVCWRCKEELVWKVTDEWYIGMDSRSKDDKSETNENRNQTLRERMKKVARQVKWIPAFGLKRELDWLENMGDWLISKKNRYWGLALPIWECTKCGNFEVVGSKEELREKAVDGWEKFEGHSPHKPFIDYIKIKCTKCGEKMTRIEPVGNPWLDAGIVAFSTISEDNKAANFDKSDSNPLYLSDKSTWEKWYPADFITESFPGQFKNWFYSLIAMSSVLENKSPFKTVLGFALACDVNGNIMHKSNPKTYISFDDAAEKVGSDIMRWIFVRQNPSENLNFGWDLTREAKRQFHFKLLNIYNFFTTYANLDGWNEKKQQVSNEKELAGNIIDLWINARLKELTKKVSKNLDDYDAQLASYEIEQFVDDFSNWYIRRSRSRVGQYFVTLNDRNEFYKTCYKVLVETSKLISPLIPFTADEIYTNLTGENSVHLTDWPEIISLSNDEEDLINNMQSIRNISELIHSQRKSQNIALKQPLSEVEVAMDTPPIFNEELLTILKDEVNIKNIKFVKGGQKVILDIKITPELKEEAESRELIRNIQSIRKDMGLALTDTAIVYTPWLPKNEKLLDWIMKKTSSKKLLKDKELKVVV